MNIDYKKKFLEIYNKNIKREGCDKILEYLEKSDFFKAPASTKFHSCHEGGLCEHSVKVYERFLKLIIKIDSLMVTRAPHAPGRFPRAKVRTRWKPDCNIRFKGLQSWYM